MKTILVTGCAGFIGSNLCETLINKGYTVIGIDNFDLFYPTAIKQSNMSAFHSHPNFTFIQADICNEEELNLIKSPVDIVVHLAAKAGVRPSIENPDAYIKANVVGTHSVLKWMQNKGLNKLVFASSSSVYGNCKQTPFYEDMNTNEPISPYAFTKKTCELLNYNYFHLYGIDSVNLRFFTVYGKRQRPDLAIHKFVKKIFANETIEMFGDGSTARDYTYVDDTVSGIIGAIDYVQNNKNVYEIINLGNNSPVTLRELIDTIARLTAITPKLKQMPMQAGDVDITFANIDKAKKLLGYSPSTSLEKGLTQFISWYKSTLSN